MPVSDGDYIFDNDINSLEQALKAEAVINIGNKLAVSERGAGANMSVDVASGQAFFPSGGIVKKTTTTNVALTAADATNPRKDIIVMDSGGTITAVAGTPAAAVPSGKTGPEAHTPKPANIPANKVLLAEVWVPANDTAITDDQITDRRVFIPRPVAVEGDYLVQGVYEFKPKSGESWADVTGITTSWVTISAPVVIDFTNIQLQACIIKCWHTMKVKNSVDGHAISVRLYNVTDDAVVPSSTKQTVQSGADPILAVSSIGDISTYTGLKEVVWQAAKQDAGDTATVYLGGCLYIAAEIGY